MRIHFTSVDILFCSESIRWQRNPHFSQHAASCWRASCLIRAAIAHLWQLALISIQGRKKKASARAQTKRSGRLVIQPLAAHGQNMTEARDFRWVTSQLLLNLFNKSQLKKTRYSETAKIPHSPCILDHLVTVCKLSDLVSLAPSN